ncbi:protein ZBED8-like [Homarus americanus]|uniref:protein ZBED8-like n=1 Tax=Homarus americanus TaxID=6706 RepID=UPI001C48E5E8|nr:protein ZBED8-like [Homarus americanus]
MDMQNDDSMKPIHASKQHFMWLDPQDVAKYEKLATETQQVLLPFPTTYLVECAFSAVTDMLTKQRGCLNICDRGDLRAKPTGFVPRFSSLVSLPAGHSGH